MPKIEQQKVTKKTTPSQTRTSKSSVLDRIQPLGFDESDGIKAVLYGQSGSGKTTLWGTFPSPILAILCSGGKKPGELRSLDTPENRKRINSVVLYESGECKEVAEGLAEGSIKAATVVLDHVSGLADLVLKEILGIDEIPAQKGWGLASQQQYGQATLQCKEILRALFNLSCNVVIIGQERVFNGGEESGLADIIQPTVGVAVSPSLAGWINWTADYVLQCFKRPRMIRKEAEVGGKKIVTEQRGKGVEYCLRCEPHDVFMTKFRMPRRGETLPEVIVDPNYEKIMKVIKGK